MTHHGYINGVNFWLLRSSVECAIGSYYAQSSKATFDLSIRQVKTDKNYKNNRTKNVKRVEVNSRKCDKRRDTMA